MRAALVLLAPLLLANADPVEIPAAVKAMLEAAMAAGNDGEVATIVKYARAADPTSGDAVAAIADAWRADRQRAREESVREAGAFALWTGRAELGGFVTTGNSETFGVTAATDLQREGLQWRHKLHLQADYQESLGITTRERYLAAYEPNYKIDTTNYIYGAAQAESDRFLGYRERYSLSTGAGYSVVQKRDVTLDLELGPAFRHTRFTDDRVENTLAGRGSLDFDWKLSPGLSVSQDASVYVQRFNSTISGTTALAAKLIGPLSARVSYNVQYESMPPLGRVSTDTIGRAALVYTF